MSYRATCLDRAASSLVLSLISVLICTAASAQSPFAGGGYSNRTAIPGNAFSRYSYSPSWAPRQPGYGAWQRPDGPPVWPSPQGVNAPSAGGGYSTIPGNAPRQPGYGAWQRPGGPPVWPAPQGVNAYTGGSVAYSGPTWQQAPPPYNSGAEGATSDGGLPPWHPKRPVKDGKPRLRPIVPVIPSPVPFTQPVPQPGTPIGETTPAAPAIPPSTPVLADAPIVPTQPDVPQPGTPIGETTPAAPASPPSTPVLADTPNVSTNVSTQPDAPQPGTPIGTSLGALGALAVSLMLALLLIKASRRQRPRNRGQNTARVVLVRDQGRTHMIPTGTAPSDPVIELRLLTSAPVSTLRLVG